MPAAEGGALDTVLPARSGERRRPRGDAADVINPPGTKRAAFFRNADLPHEPDAWKAGATAQEGSWWPVWLEWLAERSGEKRPAPAAVGSSRHPPGAKAPGTYVFARA